MSGCGEGVELPKTFSRDTKFDASRVRAGKDQVFAKKRDIINLKESCLVACVSRLWLGGSSWR